MSLDTGKIKIWAGRTSALSAIKVPSVYIPQGRLTTIQKRNSVHNPYFEIDDRAFEIGAATLAKCAFEFCKRAF